MPKQYNPNQIFLIGDGFGLFVYFERVETTQRDSIIAVGSMIVETVKDGAEVHVFDSDHIINAELIGRGGDLFFLKRFIRTVVSSHLHGGVGFGVFLCFLFHCSLCGHITPLGGIWFCRGNGRFWADVQKDPVIFVLTDKNQSRAEAPD